MRANAMENLLRVIVRQGQKEENLSFEMRNLLVKASIITDRSNQSASVVREFLNNQ